MSLCAVIDSQNIIINIMVAEPYQIPKNEKSLIHIPEGLPVMIGHTYQDPHFYDFESNIVTPYEEVGE